MSSTPVAELEAGLQAMLTLKPPGVSGSRIQSITALCMQNVQFESVLIQKLYTHFKKAPGTHKLGVLYVVDSVTRKWTEQAKSAGQPINSSAPDGTFAAGVHRVKELLPVLMNDIIQSAPNDQKEKIKKLVDIWEKGQTFPLQVLTSFKERLNSTSQSVSTTPPGSPPVNLQRSAAVQMPVPTQAPVPPARDTSEILAALANMARQNNIAPPPNPTIPIGQLQDNIYNVSSAQNNTAQQAAPLNYNQNPSLQFPPVPSVNVPAPQATFAQQPQAQAGNGAQHFASNQANHFAAPQPVIQPQALTPTMQQQLMLAKALSDQGMPHEQIVGIITAMGSQGLMGGAAAPPQAPQAPQYGAYNPAGNGGWAPEESRDRYPDAVRSPHNGFNRQRSRSASPVRGWNSRNSPRRDDKANEYSRDSPGRNRGGDDRRGRGGYRQRSPQRRQSSTPPRGGGSKWVGYDDSIGAGNIKVLSRTLFVGGVSVPDYELRNVFEQYGRVQTCIVNKDKRHAFVKMMSRADAVAAKEGMETNRAPDSPLRTRWGVGFGPRDCSDYQTGVSIIPISKLTDADRKWMLTAEFGGSGGESITPFMVVEEPDIEIGQGVSSKAISRRMQTDKGGNNGPKSSRERDEDEFGRYRRPTENKRQNEDRNDRYPAVTGPPAMPSIPPFGVGGFPFAMPTLPNGMPMFPPGFVFPGQTQQSQPPPPGRS